MALNSSVDVETRRSIQALDEQGRVRHNRVPGVRAILVVLSARGMALDLSALKQKVLQAYPDAAVFFRTTGGYPLGVPSDPRVDLLIDLTGPGQRQGFFVARRLRSGARFAVGRNAGLFRRRIYDRIFDERKESESLPPGAFDREAEAQLRVLALAGVPVIPTGDVLPDRGKLTPLELPPLCRS